MAALAPVAWADDLKPFQAQAKESAEKSVKDAVAYAERFCATKVAVTFDFGAYTAEVDRAWKGTSKGSGCAQVVEGIGYTCSGLQFAAYAAPAKKAITGVRCTFEGKEQKAIDKQWKVEGMAPNFSFDKKSGVFTYHMALGHKNVKELASEFLRNALDQ